MEDFPTLKTAPADTFDKGTVRLGSGCITGEFPEVPQDEDTPEQLVKGH